MKFEIASFLIVQLIFSSFLFSQSVHKHLVTGAFSRSDGISSNDIVIEINGKAVNRNEFIIGENVTIVFNNITGLSKSDNRTYPGLSIFVVKNLKDTILSNPNLFKDLVGGTNRSPLQLRANFKTGLLNQYNENYKVLVEIWDEKGKGRFNYELPFMVKENELLDIKNDGIKYSEIYLWNETLKQDVCDSSIDNEHLLFLILNDLEGLELVNGKVFPLLSLDIEDNAGKKIISTTGLSGQAKNEGVDPAVLKNQVVAKISIANREINNPCTLTAILKDKNSSKKILITTELIIK